MKIKRLVIGLLCVMLAFSTTGCVGGKTPLKILSSDGAVIAEYKSLKAMLKDENSAYLEIVANEAADIIAKVQKCNEKQAKKQLFKGEYTVYTAFDSDINKKLKDACVSYDGEMNVGSAVTDLNGQLVAVYSTPSKDGENYATIKTDPCSAFKPLSVYAPAIDEGIIYWSSRYEDSPYKQVKGEDGFWRDWPKNANNVYTKRYAYIFQAIKESINTVAVKCLADYGVNNSVEFLEKNFDIALSYEKYTSSVYGEDEIIGNIALGSLRKGVSPLDMAGYYQIFANGGSYTEPRAILKICDAKGNEIYKREAESKAVIKGSTSELMNRLLREVVTADGTGSKAAVEGIEIAGKTGTDEVGGNNWFVGVTPQYSCSVWHSDSTKNIAAEIYSKAVKSIYEAKPTAVKSFTYSQGLMSVAYCTETGKMAKAGCILIRLGYYTQDNVPDLCDRH